MANFQPGLRFQPGPGPSLVSDYMTKLSPGWDSSLCAGDSTITTNKMARRRLLLLKKKSFLSQLGLFLAVNDQLFGTVFGPSNDWMQTRPYSSSAYFGSEKLHLSKAKMISLQWKNSVYRNIFYFFLNPCIDFLDEILVNFSLLFDRGSFFLINFLVRCGPSERWPKKAGFLINASHGFPHRFVLLHFISVKINVLAIHLGFAVC